MNLQRLIQEYLTYCRTLGWRPRSHGGHLGGFGRFIGADVDIGDVRSDQVTDFLRGTGPVTTSWHIKYGILRSFFRHAVSRGYIGESPLPTVIPERPAAFVPYIFSPAELRGVLSAIENVCRSRSLLEVTTARTMILTLYGAGLRRQEAINLNWADVNQEESLLTIRHTKFLKSRLVPVGPQLSQVLAAYSRTRVRNADAPFFTTRTGDRIDPQMLQRYFRAACDRAGVRRGDSNRFQPRLHDLRHTFAVHRLTSWYREAADVQKVLPLLSTYLGHICIRHTQVYLTMTPDLLHEANNRFERYAEGGLS